MREFFRPGEEPSDTSGDVVFSFSGAVRPCALPKRDL